jgi:hypothetical protein
MWSCAGEPEDDATEDVGLEGLLSLALLEGLALVHGRQLEDAVAARGCLCPLTSHHVVT